MKYESLTNDNNNYYNINTKYLKLKIVIIILNLSIFLFNLFLFLKINKINKKIINGLYNNNLELKNSDINIISFLNKSYKEISNYLNNKYNYNNTIVEKKNKEKKKIHIYSTDLFDLNNHKRWIRKKLKDRFIIKFDSHQPDYLIYNIFGGNHIKSKFNNSIKIAIFTENKIPDLNEADYAIGQAHINYLDRYFKFPTFIWHVKKLKKIRDKVINNPIRQKFCAAVISNNISTDGFRLNFIKELNKYKTIDMGGRYNNNIGGRIKDKIKFLSSYKFSIAMENSECDGYISEKIIDSFLAGTIPIYYGNYMVDEYINPKSYILIRDEKDMYQKIEYIKMIDNDDEKYKKFLKKGVLIDKNIADKIEEELKLFLENIFTQDKIKAYRKNN